MERRANIVHNEADYGCQNLPHEAQTTRLIKSRELAECSLPARPGLGWLSTAQHRHWPAPALAQHRARPAPALAGAGAEMLALALRMLALALAGAGAGAEMLALALGFLAPALAGAGAGWRWGSWLWR